MIEKQTNSVWFDIADVYAACGIPAAEGPHEGKIVLYLAHGSACFQLAIDHDMQSFAVRERLQKSVGIVAGNWWFRSEAVRVVNVKYNVGRLVATTASVVVQGTPTAPFETFTIDEFNDVQALVKSLSAT